MQENKPNKQAVNMLALGHFAMDTYSAYLYPLLPLLTMKFNTSIAIITAMMSIGHICSSLAQPLFGYIADRWRKRFFLVFGLLLGSCFYSCVGIAPNLFWLGLCIGIGSLGIGFYHPQATSMMVMFSNPDNRVKEMGIFLACGTLGYSFSPLLGSSVTNFYGLKYLPLTAVFGLVCAILILKFVPKISNWEVKEENKIKLNKALCDIFTNRTILILLMIAIFKSMVSILFGTFPTFQWAKQGFSTFQIGIIIFIFLATSALGTYSSQYFEKKFGTIKTFRFSMLSTLPLTILYFMTFNRFPIFSLIFYFLIAYTAMLSVSINMVLAQKHLPQYKSIVSGIIGGFSWGVVGVFLGLFGLIAQKFGIEKLLISMAILPFVCSYFLKFIPKNEVVE